MGKTKTGGRILPILLIAGVYLAYDNGLLDNIGGGGVEVIGEGDTQVMAPNSAKSTWKQCTAQEMVNNKRCGDRKILLVNAKKMPFIARNTKLGWESGLPTTLTMNRPLQVANRRAACGKFVLTYTKSQCDEYPYAVTSEGGAGARAEEVPARENSCQGGMNAAQYPKDGEQVVVLIVYPQYIAPGPFTGADIAKDQGLC